MSEDETGDILDDGLEGEDEGTLGGGEGEGEDEMS